MQGIFVFFATLGSLALAVQLGGYYLYKINPQHNK